MNGWLNSKFCGLWLLLLCSSQYRVDAQVMLYQHDTSIKVIAYGREQSLAWCGGFTNPQFAMADLNGDGKKDLVVFESYNGLRTFINQGTAGSPVYKFAPDYALKFPPIHTFLIMADYNCDGIADLFEGNAAFAVHRGYYNAGGQLCFSYYKDLEYANDAATFGFSTPAFLNPGDIPAIVDIDNDGDLDYVAYDNSGGTIRLYKDMRVEEGLPCDTIKIKLKDKCWGKVYQGFYREHTLGYSCNNSGLSKNPGGKVTHSGNTPCLFDWDMDGDYDYLDGSVSWNNMTFLKNGKSENGIAHDSMVYQDTLWQTGGKQIEQSVWPAAFNVDVDQDGKKDLLVAPHGGSASDNVNCIWYYKNYSTTGVPDWRFMTDSMFADRTIDVGSAAYPALFDYDKDGLLDLFIGSDGYRINGSPLLSKLSFYRNTTLPGNASFTLQTTDFMNLATAGFKGTAPAFGDIDGDGKTDLLLGHSDGTISYYKNMAASETVVPDWQLVALVLEDEAGDAIRNDGYAAPFVYDIDRDGKMDLIVGGIFGQLLYCQNVSTVPGTLKLKKVTTKLGKIKADPAQFIGNYSVPFIGKIDSSGMDYLLLGSNSGNIYQFTGFQTGDTTATYSLVDGQFSYIDSSYQLYTSGSQGAYQNLRNAPTVGDIDNDGHLEMIVGNTKGGVSIYKRKPFVPVKIAPPAPIGYLKIFPNPASTEVLVSWSGYPDTETNMQVQVVNILGQVVSAGSVPAYSRSLKIPLTHLPSGAYFCVVYDGTNRHFARFVIAR